MSTQYIQYNGGDKTLQGDSSAVHIVIIQSSADYIVLLSDGCAAALQGLTLIAVIRSVLYNVSQVWNTIFLVGRPRLRSYIFKSAH